MYDKKGGYKLQYAYMYIVHCVYKTPYNVINRIPT